MKKHLLILSLAVFLAGCPSTPDTDGTVPADSGTKDAVTSTPSATGLVLPAPIDGIKEGTKEDFAARIDAKVFFDLNKSDLKPAGRDTLRLQALWLKAYPDAKVTIEGHCDERGTREYNQALGEKRATRAKDFLVSQGIASSRIKVISYGKERPEFTEATESAYAKNRRGVTVIR